MPRAFPIFPEGSNTTGLLAGLLLDSQSETSLILYRPITMLLSNGLCLLFIVYGIFISCQLLSRSLSLTECWVSHDSSLIFSAMSISQSNRQASEFRTILSRINEIKTSLQGSDREEVSKKLDEMKAIRPISQMPCLKRWKGCRRAWKTVLKL